MTELEALAAEMYRLLNSAEEVTYNLDDFRAHTHVLKQYEEWKAHRDAFR